MQRRWVSLGCGGLLALGVSARSLAEQHDRAETHEMHEQHESFEHHERESEGPRPDYEPHRVHHYVRPRVEVDRYQRRYANLPHFRAYGTWGLVAPLTPFAQLGY